MVDADARVVSALRCRPDRSRPGGDADGVLRRALRRLRERRRLGSHASFVRAPAPPPRVTATLAVTELHPLFAAEVQGVDLRHVDAAQTQAIVATMDRYA